MTREDLKKIVEGITDEQLKSILDINTSDIGKAKGDVDRLKTEIGNLKKDKTELESKITELTEKSDSADDYKSQLEKLQKSIKDKEEAEKAEKADAELTASIEASFGDKKFTSDYVRRGLIADMKSEIAKPENRSKSYAEILEALTNDKDGIYVNENPPADMKGMGSLSTDTMKNNAMRIAMGLEPEKSE